MSKFTLKGRKGGFTLVEIMIVVLIIGILLAIAIPNFMKARETSRTKACMANLKTIDTAKQQWAMDSVPPVASGAACAAGALDAYIKGGEAALKCPSAGTYTNQAVDTDPTCSIGGAHALP